MALARNWKHFLDYLAASLQELLEWIWKHFMILWDAELTRFDWLFPIYPLLISLKTEWRQLLKSPYSGLGRKLFIHLSIGSDSVPHVFVPIQLQAESG